MTAYYGEMAGNSAPAIASCQAGEIRSVYGAYNLSAALSSGDVVHLVKLPAGHVPVDAVLDWDDMGTTGAASLGITADDVGTTEDADAFLSAQDMATAAGIARAALQAGFRIAAVNNDRLVGVTMTADTTATSGKIGVTLFYRAKQSRGDI